MGEKRYGPYFCGIDAAMDVVGGKWKSLILWELHEHGTRTYIANSPSKDDAPATRPAGEAFIEGCTLSVPVRWEPLDVKVRVRAASAAPRESNVWVNVYEIAGRWYLVVMQEKP